MRLLTKSEQAIVPVDQLSTPMTVIVITDPATAQQLLLSTSDTIPYRQLQKHCKDIPRTYRLQQLISQERVFLQETTAEFLNSTKRFIGIMISWILWRMVVPMAVLSVVWMAVGGYA